MRAAEARAIADRWLHEGWLPAVEGEGRVAASAEPLSLGLPRRPVGRSPPGKDGQRRETELERDEAGRVVTEIRDGVVTRYGYDPAGQLTSAEGPEGARTYGYDAAGRLVAETGPAGATTYAYDEAGQLWQRRLGAELTEYGYDSAGRRITETSRKLTRTFTWSPRGDLTGIHRRRRVQHHPHRRRLRRPRRHR